MAQQAPGKHHRQGLTLMQVIEQFATDEQAEAWFIECRWPDGMRCPRCNGENVCERKHRKPQPYRCRDCRRDFSLKTGTCMQGSNIPLRKWAVAFYLLSTNLKGVSSMKLHRDLGITQKSAWHMAHRIREMWNRANVPFAGPVEVDETWVGGKEQNRHQSKKHGTGPGAGKSIVVGAKDRASNQIAAEQIHRTDRATLHGFVQDHAADDAEVYTDEHRSYEGLPHHQAVKHSVGQYVNGQVSTQGIDSFWSMVKRGYHGTFHHFSQKHLDKYVNEFAGRHNVRPRDTADQMAALARGATGKRLRYQDLTAGGPAYPQEAD